MKTHLAVILLLVLFLPAASAYAVCNTPRPVFPEGVPPGSRPPRDAPPEDPPSDAPPADPSTDPATPGGGAEDPPPSDAPPTAPPPPSAPAGGVGPAGPAGTGRGSASAGRSRRGPSYAGSWYVWWELNRENLLGLRTAMRGREAVTDDGDPVAVYRDDVRAALRGMIEKPYPDDVRAEALRALGRAGWDADAPLFLKILKANGTTLEVREAAAIGLGILPTFKDPAMRDQVREFADQLIAGKLPVSQRARLTALMALGLRARGDAYLTAALGASSRRPLGDADDAAALLFALGLTGDPMLGEELKAAVREGKIGDRRLHDVSRAHGTLALALCGDASAIDVYAKILEGNKNQVQTRRSAAIGMGIVLRRQDVPEKVREVAVKALELALDKDRDPLVAGYAAVGLGYAKQPAGIDALIRVAGKSGGAVEGPYAILALGLAARNLPEEKADKVRRFLVTQYKNCRDLEQSGALAIAAGIAGATDARDLFLKRVANASTPLRVRALAAQGLGLLGQRSQKVEEVLEKALADGAPMISENAAIALGLLGRNGTARLLVKTLTETRSKSLQLHMVVAMAHLGGTRAIAPLVEILKDGKADDRVLRCAANTLGILVDQRDHDLLMEVDASVNAYGMTVVTRTLVVPF